MGALRPGHFDAHHHVGGGTPASNGGRRFLRISAILRSTCPDVPAADTAVAFVSGIAALAQSCLITPGLVCPVSGERMVGPRAGCRRLCARWRIPVGLEDSEGQAVSADSCGRPPSSGGDGCRGCSDTISIQLTAPPPLSVSTRWSPITGVHGELCGRIGWRDPNDSLRWGPRVWFCRHRGGLAGGHPLRGHLRRGGGRH